MVGGLGTVTRRVKQSGHCTRLESGVYRIPVCGSRPLFSVEVKVMRTLLLVFLLVGCTKVDVPFVERVESSNDHPTELHWYPEDFPLEVVADKRIPPTQQFALQEAITEWNEAVGFTAFTLSREIDWWNPELSARLRGTVYVQRYDISDLDFSNEVQGIAILDLVDTQIRSVAIFLDVDVSEENVTLVLKHELGHSLGLVHDFNPASVMYPQESPQGGYILSSHVIFARWEADTQFSEDTEVIPACY